jgi:type II secretory ATPase GspE/PulE/Tfp pilus assembly ATPase PilB-like protein
LVNWVVSQEPDVIVASSLEDVASARDLIAHAARGKRAIVGIRAVGALEALAAWRKLVGDDSAYEHVSMLVAGRLVRKICPMCKMAYEPDPASLRKMNLDPNRVQQLFQERTEPLVDSRGNPISCDFCQDIHFKGRTGVFEVLPVDQDMRQLLQSNASAVQLRALWKKRGAKFLQDAAFEAVAAGEVSVREVMRVFKLDEQSRTPK